MNTLSRLRYVAYGLLGLPLAMSALPVYIQVPTYYTSHLGLALASTGWVLFLARLVDTVQDPWLGRCIDRLDRSHVKLWMLAGALMLALAFWGIWLPPQMAREDSTYLLTWLGAMLIVAYTAHSMLNIAYLAWGARLSNAAEGLLGAAAVRETAGLLGAIIASVIPSLILARSGAVDQPLGSYAWVFAVLLLVAMLALLYGAPRWVKVNATAAGWRASMAKMSANKAFRRLLLPYFLNAVSVSIPATLALFFINDRLQAPQYAGNFLATYFVATAIGLPFWVAAAKRLGVLSAWRLGMLLAIVAFAGAALLGPGDVWLYGVVCVAAGLALGADLALPPVLLATVIGEQESTADYYGIWTLLAKLALAFAGLALPLLALLGYVPGMAGSEPLAWVYAALPCAFKLAALLLLKYINAPDQVLPLQAHSQEHGT